VCDFEELEVSRDARVERGDEMTCFFGCGRVNFGSKYLGFCSDFVQHACTHLRGVWVSFSMNYLKILSDLEFLKFKIKCRKKS
jgi:hypothetical protein